MRVKLISMPNQIDEINTLPDELLIQIFKYLSINDIQACELVCQRWNKLSSLPSLWRTIQLLYSEKANDEHNNKRTLDIILNHSEKIYLLKLLYIYDWSLLTKILDKCSSNIISLEIVMCRIEDSVETERYFAKWPNLKRISFRNTILKKSGDVTIQFSQFKLLNYLSLSEFGLNSNNCDSLLHCQYLSHIKIEKIKNLKLEYIISLIESKKDILQTFHFYGKDAASNNCIKLLSECPLLKDLAIIRCENLSDEGLVKLKNFNKLTALQLWNNSTFTERCLLDTLNAQNLFSLKRLSFSHIANVSLSVIDVICENYKNLNFLAMYQCPKLLHIDYERQLEAKVRHINIFLY